MLSGPLPGAFSTMLAGTSKAAVSDSPQKKGFTPEEEASFQKGIRDTEWFKEFVKQYGEEPDLSAKADYDYRAAWQAGIRPERNAADGNRYHWASSAPDGSMLKSADHPTAWKEHYMRATGVDPDVAGVTKEQWEKMQSEQQWLLNGIFNLLKQPQQGAPVK